MDEIGEYAYTQPPLELYDVLSEAKMKGCLHLKQLGKNVYGNLERFEIGYRKKANEVYGRKMSKPFKMFEESEYKRERRFSSDFKEFVKSIPEFESIKESQNTKEFAKEIYESTLIYQPKNKDEKNFNIKKRKPGYGGIGDGGMFPTYPSIGLARAKQSKDSRENKKNREKAENKRDVESRVEIILNSSKGIERSASLLERKNKDIDELVRIKKSSENKIKSIRNLEKSRSGISCSNRSLFGEAYINENVVLANLNNLLETDHKPRNFRLSRVKLHEIIQKRYGHDSITNFFTLQASEDLEGAIKFGREILSMAPEIGLLLTFLIFDKNKDGVITEDEIMGLKDVVGEDSLINEDINTLIKYIKNNMNLKCERDLPQSFINFPTFKEYIRIQNNRTGEKREIRDKGVYRFFSLKEDDDDHRLSLSAEKGYETISKKNIQINFHHFQKAFEICGIERPKFIQEVITLLLGKDYGKKEEETKAESPIRKYTLNLSHGRRDRKLNSSDIGSRTIDVGLQRQESSLSKAHEILKSLHSEHKNLKTVHFD